MAESETTVPSARTLSAVTFAAGFGGFIEYFDLFIATFAGIIVWPKLFFAGVPPNYAIAYSLASVGITFLVRPFGGFIFGHIGDKTGRRNTLVVTLAILGKYNSKIRRSKKDRGTNLFYTHASLHIVERGRRVTIFTVPVLALDDHARMVERLILEARKRGIRIHTLLIDRGFFSVDVVNVLRRHRVRFLMPAVKNDRVKEAIEGFHLGRTASMTRFTMENADARRAWFNLLMYRKEDAKASDPVHKQYIAFATSMPHDEAMAAFHQIPEEYRRRWGIESGFRVQDNVQAKTTSTDYTVRTVYLMLSIFLYNLWVLANVIEAQDIGIEPEEPLMKLSQMAKFFTMWTELPEDPPP